LLDLDTIVARVTPAVAASDIADPVPVRFLLARYAATGDEPLSAVVGGALALGLEQYSEAPPGDRAEWLLLFGDAATWSDDRRVREAAASLLATIDARAVAAIEAALHASAAIGDGARLSSAVDDLERLIGGAYEPGDGVASVDQYAAASALLTAFDVTGRLPYAMLAEEVVQTALRRGDAHDDAESACGAARVLCRLAALHGDDVYVNAAVVAAGADYIGASAHLLDEYEARALETMRGTARYGLALAHWLGLH
jgi:hypothetical protein